MQDQVFYLIGQWGVFGPYALSIANAIQATIQQFVLSGLVALTNAGMIVPSSVATDAQKQSALKPDPVSLIAGLRLSMAQSGPPVPPG